MGQNTKIQWADDTVNAWWGCTHKSAACVNCYAEMFSKRLGKDLWGPNADRWIRVEAALAEIGRIARRARKEGKPRRIFVNSMSDLFEDRADLVEPRKQFLGGAAEFGHDVILMMLTKRSDVMLDYYKTQGVPDWWWALVTGENQREADKRLPDLVQMTGMAVRGVSSEPLLSGLDLTPWLTAANLEEGQKPVSWVIAGGESGRTRNGPIDPVTRRLAPTDIKPMHPAWATGLRDQCEASGVPYHFKQWGAWKPSETWTHALPPRNQLALFEDGTVLDAMSDSAPQDVGAQRMLRFDKKTNGRDLDGAEHDGLPPIYSLSSEGRHP